MTRDLESAPAQQKVLNVILDASERGESALTEQEITDAIGLTAKSNVHRALEELQRKGYIEREKAASHAKHRAIRPTKKAWTWRLMTKEPKSAPPEQRVAEEWGVRLVPLLWRVAAGQPILADDNVRDHLPLPRKYVRGSAVFMLEVKGDSMTGDGVLDGDYVVVVSDPAPRNGEMVVALIEGEATVKRLWRQQDEVWLESSNPIYPPILLEEGMEALIRGRVVAVVRWHIEQGRQNHR